MSEQVSDKPGEKHLNVLRGRRLGIETHHEAIAFMRADCHVCRAEGFNSHARIRITRGRRSIIATLYRASADLVQADEVGLSESAWSRLGLSEGDDVAVSHPPVVESFGAVRGKVYGRPLEPEPTRAIIRDVMAGYYSDIHLSSFITACAAGRLDRAEIIALTGAMVDVGERLDWPTRPVMDKHCIGGLPGNRTTPIVVAIVASRGFTIPKTSSRAITSPAGTADTMETIAPVDLDTAAMRRVIEREGGCVVWGGAVRLSPADDRLIRVERALNLDSGGQLVASVLSKKIAAGATHLVLDLPVGATAKLRSEEEARALEQMLSEVAAAFGIAVRVVVSDGSEPVGRRIGPALEARDVLAVLRGDADAPGDLRERSLTLAGTLLELGGAAPGEGYALARAALGDGHAWRKFQGICEAQGGMREPPVASQHQPVTAAISGKVSRIDNRRLAELAKLAGAPDAKAAGVELLVRVGDTVEAREPLFAVHSETRGELAYAMDYLAANPGIFTVDDGSAPRPRG
jgi:thymidine phosphorylase